MEESTMEESTDVIEQPSGNRKSTPPRPPKPYGSVNKDYVSLSNGQTQLTKKPSIAKEKPVAPTANVSEGGNIQLACAGETILETFYGMLYKCDGETKEWKLAASGFIPLCFIQEHGNANKPFKVIAAHGSVRLMEFPVTKETKCTLNKAFVRWHDSPNKMYGVRFAKESQGDQFYSGICRMKSTLLKTAELFKQPKKKAMVNQIGDPTTKLAVSHTKISLIVKLPNKETTIISVPGLILMDELLDLICKKENLSRSDHVLTLPKAGDKEVNYGPDTIVGSLNIKEIFVTNTEGTSSSLVTKGRVSLKEPQTRIIDESQVLPRPDKDSYNGHALSTFHKQSLAKSDEYLDQQKKEAVKVKRRAPRPPQKPPERPKSMPNTRPHMTESGSLGSPPAIHQSKKRQAPARPPAPKISRDEDEKIRYNVKDERLPPEFVPPPPPDDIPPPLDECEHPVSPLSEADLHETAWLTGGGDHDSPRKNATDIPSCKVDESRVSEDLVSSESIPLKFLLPSEVEGESDENTVERDRQSSRISFIGDSRSSSVDFSSDHDTPTSLLLEVYKDPLDLQEVNITTTEDEPRSISPPLQPDYSNEIKSETISLCNSSVVPVRDELEQDVVEFTVRPPPALNGNDAVEHPDRQSMVIPPPPTMFEDSPEEKDSISTESITARESEGNFSIPPPLEFAGDGNELHDELRAEGPFAKKKLGLSTEMFPWRSEPQSVFQAEISRNDFGSDVVRTENETSSEIQTLIPSQDEVDIERPRKNDKEQSVFQGEISSNNFGSDVLPTENESPREMLSLSTSQDEANIERTHENDKAQSVFQAEILASAVEKEVLPINNAPCKLEALSTSDGKVSTEKLPKNDELVSVYPTAMPISSNGRGFQPDKDEYPGEFHAMRASEEELEKPQKSVEPQLNFQEQISTNFNWSDVSPLERKAIKKQFFENSDNKTSLVKPQEYGDQELAPKKDTVDMLSIETREKATTNYEAHITPPNIETLKTTSENSSEKEIEFTSDNSSTIGNPKCKPSKENNEKENLKSTSFEEDLSNYRTPFDDVEGMGYSASESDDEFLDMKNLDTLDKNEKVIQGRKMVDIADAYKRSHKIGKEACQDEFSSNVSSTGVNESVFRDAGVSSDILSSSEPKVESSSVTPIAIPMDILFQSLERSSPNSEAVSSPASDKNCQKSKSDPKLSSGFKKQSWADIKNQEKRMREKELKARPSTREMEKSAKAETSTRETAVISKHASATAATEHKKLQEQVTDSHSTSTSAESLPILQSWAEIKYQEKIMEEERQRKIEIENVETTNRVGLPKEEENRAVHGMVVASTESTVSITPDEARQETRKPHSYVSSAVEKRSSSNIVKTDSKTSQSEIQNAPGRIFANPTSKRHMGLAGNSKTTALSGTTYTTKERQISSDSIINENVEGGNEQNLPTVAKVDNRQLVYQGVQNVVMRKKSNKGDDTIQKRKSVQDMMKMFSTEEDPEGERSDSSDLNPRQSPALRLLEEKMGCREKMSDQSCNPESVTRHLSVSGSTVETKLVRVENVKPQIEDTTANVPVNKTHIQPIASKEAVKTNPQQITDSSNVRSRTNFLNPKPYGVLFPMEQKSSSKVTQSNDSIAESKKQTDLTYKKSIQSPNSYAILFPEERNASQTSAEAKDANPKEKFQIQPESKSNSTGGTKPVSVLNVKEDNKGPTSSRNMEQIQTAEIKMGRGSLAQACNSKVYDQQSKGNEEKSSVPTTIALVESTSKPVELRKKESLSDPTKRYSMPAKLVESASSNTSCGKNLKILLAPQISDVNVVPKGRVAAMMAAWKNDDQ